MSRKGETWNESEVYRDALTLRQVRRLTRAGLYNQTPTYHTNVTFTADGEFLVFGSARVGGSVVIRAHVPSGDLTQLTDPLPGVGGNGEWHKGGASVGDGAGINGTMCLAPRSRWTVYMAGRSLRAVHLDSLDERILVPDIGPEWLAGMPSVDPTETSVLLPLMPAHPQLLAGQRPTRHYWDAVQDSGVRWRILEVPLAGGEARTVYAEEGCTSAHTPHSPADPDLILIDRDFPPRFWGGSDGHTNRIWTLRLSTGQLTELPPLDAARFQVHSVWTYDGELVLYHGKRAEGGHYIGATYPSGQVYREYAFDQAPHYGHVSAMAGRPAILLDGNLTPDTLVWVYYDAEQPRVELVARHGTDWNALPGQYPLPHPHSDPTGRWISFNRGEKGRTDVYVVRV